MVGMAIASRRRMSASRGLSIAKRAFATLVLAVAFAPGITSAAATEQPKAAPAKAEPVKGADVAKAEAARKKPLQRCDELADKAQLECLQKARERIVEARQKREASAKSGNKVAPVKEAPRQ